MTDYKYQLEGMKIEKQSLLSVRAKLVRLKKDALGKRGEFKKAQQDKKNFLKKIKKKKQFRIRTRKELQNASKNLNSLITKIIVEAGFW